MGGDLNPTIKGLRRQKMNHIQPNEYINKKTNGSVFDSKNVVYLITSKDVMEKERAYFIRKSKSLGKEIEDEFRVVYYVECSSINLMDMIEGCVSTVLDRYKDTKNGDAYKLPENNNNVTIFTSVFEKFFKIFKNCSECIKLPTSFEGVIK